MLGAPQKPGAGKPKQERPAVEKGDHIYFQNAGGKPFKGRVLAHGEHGCTVHHGETNSRHKVRWEQYLGHHSRVQPALKVVEEGEDGFLAKDVESGRTRYVHDPLVDSEGDDGDLLKSLVLASNPKAGPSAIERLVAIRESTVSPLAKALKAAEGRAGGGKAEKKPKTKPRPPVEHRDARPTDRVKFKAGAFEGEGEIVSHGHAGAHVKDAEGRIHRVGWHEVTDRQPGTSEASAKGILP